MASISSWNGNPMISICVLPGEYSQLSHTHSVLIRPDVGSAYFSKDMSVNL